MRNFRDSIQARPRQEGIALIAAILVGMILVVLGMLLVSLSFSESTQSVRNVRIATAAQAAEAGLDDYVAKLTQDHYYALHWVHPAEPPRVSAVSGTVTAPGQPWNGEKTWTYAASGATWKHLANGYEYQVRVAPPAAGSTSVLLTTSGRRTAGHETRTFESLVRPATPLDFQYITQADLKLESTATTRGKLYVGQRIKRDASGDPVLGPDGKPIIIVGNLIHPGKAHADIMAEGSITGPPTLSGAHQYSQSSSDVPGKTVRTVVKNPLDFDQLTVGSVSVNQAAISGGIVLDDPNAAAWRLVFNSNGTLSYTPCKRAGTGIPAPKLTNGKWDTATIANGTALPYYADTSTPRTCNYAPTTTVNLAATNGAVYVAQTALVSGAVNGRVTVAANVGIVVEGPTTYVDPTDDVLGLVSAETNLWIANYVISGANKTFSWNAGLLIPKGKWQVRTGSPVSGSVMNFYGSLTAFESGNMSAMFATRNYNYDPNLQFLQPPYFPVLEDAYSIQSFREVAPAA